MMIFSLLIVVGYSLNYSLLLRLPQDDTVNCLEISDDGGYVVGCVGNALHIYEYDDGYYFNSFQNISIDTGIFLRVSMNHNH